MITITGKYAEAKIFTDNVESEVIVQVLELCNQSFVSNCNVRVMPDTHAGKGCVIGFTANLGDKVIPNIVGVDIGCGMLLVNLGNINIDLNKLDQFINDEIPYGMSSYPEEKFKFSELEALKCYDHLSKLTHIKNSVGTLGGGNHFIEIGVDKANNKYLIIHSGSRNLGMQVAVYYQDLATRVCRSSSGNERDHLIKELKKAGRQQEINSELEKLKERYQIKHVPSHLCYLTGDERQAYLHDMEICQKYAKANREMMAQFILNNMFSSSLKKYECFHTIHNYIAFKDNIIRKGSISAYENEKVLIPINMRDGSILGVGKGNKDWNYSAPHGAGRLMSRSQAKKMLSLDEFKETMSGVFSSSVCMSTIDEAPMAYKPIEEIISNIKETVDIIDIIKPIYNFKAKS